MVTWPSVYRSAGQRDVQTSSLVYAPPEGKGNHWLYGIMGVIPLLGAIAASIVFSPSSSVAGFVIGAGQSPVHHFYRLWSRKK